MGTREENNERSLDAIFMAETIFNLFMFNPDKSYFECAEEFLRLQKIKMSKKEKEQLCQRCLFFQRVSLWREIFCLVQNAVKRQKVDLTNKFFVDEINELKAKTIVKGDKATTNYDYIKAIRNVFAHNDEMASMQKLEYFPSGNSYKMVISSENPELVIDLRVDDLYKICHAMFKGINKFEGFKVYARRLENAIVGGHFKMDELGRYMSGTRDGEPYELILDEHQKTSLDRYLKSGVREEDKLYYFMKYRSGIQKIRYMDPSLIKQVFPSSSKPEDLALHKTFMCHVLNIISADLNRTKDDVLDCSENRSDEINLFINYFLNSNYANFLLVTNGLYSVLSDRELEDVESEFIDAIGSGNARHVRNAMQHGTYYYNFNKGLEIYDGGKRLKHITTLDLNEVAYGLHKIVIDRYNADVKE